MMRSFALSAWLLSALLLPARAQDIDAGRQLARRWCSECHDVGRNQAGNSGVAPSFRSIATAKGATELSVRVFLSSWHTPMPNFVLSDTQIRDVSAYIASLRDGGA